TVAARSWPIESRRAAFCSGVSGAPRPPPPPPAAPRPAPAAVAAAPPPAGAAAGAGAGAGGGAAAGARAGVGDGPGAGALPDPPDEHEMAATMASGRIASRTFGIRRSSGGAELRPDGKGSPNRRLGASAPGHGNGGAG